MLKRVQKILKDVAVNITEAGRMMLGSSDEPEAYLHIKETGGGTSLRIESTDTSSPDLEWKVPDATTGDEHRWHAYINPSGGAFLIIDETGTGNKSRFGIYKEANGKARIQIGQGGVPVLFRLDTVSTVERDALTDMVAGDTIFNSTTSRAETYDGSGWTAASEETLQEVTDAGSVTTNQITAGKLNVTAANPQIDIEVDGEQVRSSLAYSAASDELSVSTDDSGGTGKRRITVSSEQDDTEIAMGSFANPQDATLLYLKPEAGDFALRADGHIFVNDAEVRLDVDQKLVFNHDDNQDTYMRAVSAGGSDNEFEFYNQGNLVFTITENDNFFATNKIQAQAGIQTLNSTADVSSPPTDAELDAEFGTPAAAGAGFVATLDDNGAGTAGYLVWSDGTNWWHAAGTKAL